MLQSQPHLAQFVEDTGWVVVAATGVAPNCGTKAIGLAELPDAWSVPWVVVPIPECERALATSRWADIAQCLVAHFRAEGETIDAGFIVRSSGQDEDLDKRGQLESVTCSVNLEEMATALRRVALQEKDDAPANGAVVCALVVQPYLQAQYRGHLSNEYRHAQRSVDFLYEIEDAGAEATKLSSFRLQRPVAGPDGKDLEGSLQAKSIRDVEQRLRLVAAWLAARKVRGHIEWLVAGGRLRLVQLDPDVLPPKVLPMAEAPPVERFAPNGAKVGRAFITIDSGSDLSGLRKTRSHALLKAAGAFVPPIFVARNVGKQIGDLTSDFWRELNELLATPSIIRFDVPMERAEWTNLPTIGPLTSSGDPISKIQKAVDTVTSRGVDLAELSVVVHQFIAARAAAWSEASPSLDRVRIDAIWGLPDGLQSLVHDSIIYTPSTNLVKPQIRYKDRFVDVGADGGWLLRRAAPSLAREEACKSQDVRKIGDVTLSVARATNRTVRIMWFLDVLAGAGLQTPSAMPWIVVELENQDDAAPHPSQPLSPSLRRQADLHGDRRVENRATLQRFRRDPQIMDLGGRHVLLQPDALAVRDRSFLEEFAKAVKELPNQWKVVYAGSMLAHAPYQLKQLGIAVLPLHQEVRPPRRTFQRKLVRDGIPGRVAAGGEHAEVVKLDDREFQLALRQKLVEEALEVGYSTDADELREELADLLDVAQALCAAGEVGDWSEVEAAAADKTARRGGFAARLFLRATGFRERAAPAKPGSAPVERLRNGDGLRIPLVPPLLSGERKSVIDFRRLGLKVVVEFREQHVHVRLVGGDGRRAQPSGQLELFGAVEDDDEA